MHIYLDSGYLNIPLLISQGMPFIFATGGRGTGKTYGTLEWVLENHIPFIYMRRTMAEIELLWKTEELNPFKAINKNKGWNIGVVRDSKYTGAVVARETAEDGTMSVAGAPLGTVLALSTIANLRGFSADHVQVLIYDEFIPELHTRKIRDEHMAFMNAYETINRNRELTGQPPLLCICLSNSNRLDNDLYMGLGLVTKVDKMKRNKQEVSIMHKRGILLVNMEESPISEQKAQTALYRMADGTGFDRMALKNEYIGEDERGKIGAKPLREYNPVCIVGEICIYRHKSKREYYVSTHFTGSPPSFGTGDAERKRFRKAFGWIYTANLDGIVFFESRICEILLTKYLK